MRITINLYYSGEGDNATNFAREMTERGIVDRVRAEEGNEGYEYFFPMEDSHSVLLVDKWRDQFALDVHHKSGMMQEIAELRKKYKLKLRVEKFIDFDEK